MNNSDKSNQFKSKKEIDLIALLKMLWKGRRTIIKSVVVCSLAGLIIALFSPKEYTASATLVPQTSNNTSNLGGLSSLASIAGFNIDLTKGGGNELSPQVYPQIVQSVPFQLEIMKTPFSFSEIDHPVSLLEYYSDYYTPGLFSSIAKYSVGLPGLLLKSFRNEDNTEASFSSGSMLRLSEKQEEIRKIVAKHLVLEINEKEGYVKLSSSFFEPELAAQVAQKAKELLQQYITDFKVEKAKAQLKFVEERYNEKKKDLEDAQADLASFRDKNKNVTSAMALTEESRLENEYQLAFDVYSSLAQQMEQARIKVKEDTPVFSVIRPVIIPFEKSKPNRPLILIIWIFLGGILGVGLLFGKEYIKIIKESGEAEAQ
ncbi:Wzz/FepE/Etk N-terminal domain-containing protein [Maribellus maritimus]|uniref:Wzz/FepE/Etk N-terminal domain-containing protein n=1 Tax=Maribellus maritimus TaxID=2870838 RepID=UPI001EE9DB8E|nr:Wzz/FepE/Etk N-terminal domain-containing protein [Maribellus maritimus]MCG6191381.1 lipopolysaccharide biosynthesis protein [Maribellus maritimus]